MELWAGQAEATGGIVRFLSLADLCRLRRVSKAGAALADSWFKYLQADVHPKRQITSKGEDPDENYAFLDALDLATARGARIRSLDFAPIADCGVPERVLFDRLLSRVAVAGLADRSLKALFVRRNARETLGPCIKALPCFSGLRRLHLDVEPDISSPRTQRGHLLAALKGRHLRELSFRPSDFGFSAADLAAIPGSLGALELRCDSDGILENVKAWLAATELRGCTQLRLAWLGEGTRQMSLWRLPEAFPSLERLALVLISPRVNYSGRRLDFRRLRSLSLHCDTDWGRLALEPPQPVFGFWVNVNADRSNAAGAEIVAFLRAFSADAQASLESLTLIGEFGFSDARDFDVLSQLSGLRDIALDPLCTLRERDLLAALETCHTLQKLANLERLSFTGLCCADGTGLLWPRNHGNFPNSARSFVRTVLNRLSHAFPPSLRRIQLDTRKAGAQFHGIREPLPRLRSGTRRAAVPLAASRVHSEASRLALDRHIGHCLRQLFRRLPRGETLCLGLAPPLAAEVGQRELAALASERRDPGVPAPLHFATSEPPFPMAFDV